MKLNKQFLRNATSISDQSTEKAKEFFGICSFNRLFLNHNIETLFALWIDAGFRSEEQTLGNNLYWN